MGAAPGAGETARQTLVLVRVTTPGETAIPLRRALGPVPTPDSEQPLLQTLKANRMTFDFSDTPLTAVAAFMREATGVNLVIDPRVFDEMPEEELRVNLALDGVAALDCLQLIADILRLRVTAKR